MMPGRRGKAEEERSWPKDRDGDALAGRPYESSSQGSVSAVGRIAKRALDISRLRCAGASNTIRDAAGRSLRNRDVTDLLERLDTATSGGGATTLLRTVVSQGALSGHSIGRSVGLDDFHHDVRPGNSEAAGSGFGLRSPDRLYHVQRDVATRCSIRSTGALSHLLKKGTLWSRNRRLWQRSQHGGPDRSGWNGF